MAKAKRYMVTNNTIKPKRVDLENGRDMRTTEEKVGCFVSFTGDSNRSVMLAAHPDHPSHFAIVSDVNDGMLRLERMGHVKIEEIDDITQVFKKHTVIDPLPPVTEEPRLKRDENRVRATEMGQDTYQQKGGVEHEAAVNPDGDPNFVVRASRGRKRKERYAANEG